MKNQPEKPQNDPLETSRFKETSDKLCKALKKLTNS